MNIIETVQKISDRCLTSPGRTNKCNLLSWLRIHPHIMKHDLIITITKIYAIKNNIALHW